MRVLWIDDNAAFLRSQQRILRAHHDVRTASTAAEGFAILAVERFDVILCDVNLPGMTGPTFFKRLSPLDAARTIFVTAGPRGEDQTFIAQYPTVLKPFTPEQLLVAMHAVATSAAG